MSDRQELIDWLRHWKHEVPTTREREEMIEAMRDAATALEEAQGVPPAVTAQELAKLREAFELTQRVSESNERARAMLEALGVPREPTMEMIVAAVKACNLAWLPVKFGTVSDAIAAIWRAMYDAAPAAPTRDEQDARLIDRVREWRRNAHAWGSYDAEAYALLDEVITALATQ